MSTCSRRAARCKEEGRAGKPEKLTGGPHDPSTDNVAKCLCCAFSHFVFWLGCDKDFGKVRRVRCGLSTCGKVESESNTSTCAQSEKSYGEAMAASRWSYLSSVASKWCLPGAEHM